MAIQTLYPNQKPSLLLDFANVKALDPRITFTRTTTAVFYNGVTTAKAEENLLIRSQEFDTVTAWGNSGTTVAANTGDTTAPDGTSTAEEITASAGAAVHVIDAQPATYSTINGAQYAYSVFAKKGTLNFIQLYVQADGTTHANFDLDTGVVGTTGGTVTTAITSVGNGWYRCSMIFTAGGTDRRIGIALVNSSSATRRLSWTAAGTEDVYLWGAQAEQRSAVTAYTPTTTQPITNYIPVLLTAASGVARFDHNPTTGESLGLLVEEQRTNLVTYSEAFNDAAWGKVRASVVANQIIAPDGTLTADKVLDNTDNNIHYVNSVYAASAVLPTLSVYIKAGERTQAFVQGVRDNGAGTSTTLAVIDLTNGTVVSGTATVQNVGNGWYRVSQTATITATTNYALRVGPASGGTATYTGNGYDGIYIWGAQLEAGAFPTSYIPTVAATVTRNADAASMTGTNFSSWYRADEGTVYAESLLTRQSALGGTAIFQIQTQSTDRIRMFYRANGSTGAQAAVSSVNECDFFLSGILTENQIFKGAFGYKVNDFAGSGNAGTVQTDTAGTIPVVTNMIIGAGDQALNGTIKKIAYYPIRATNAQLVALTS